MLRPTDPTVNLLSGDNGLGVCTSGNSCVILTRLLAVTCIVQRTPGYIQVLLLSALPVTRGPGSCLACLMGVARGRALETLSPVLKEQQQEWSEQQRAPLPAWAEMKSLESLWG